MIENLDFALTVHPHRHGLLPVTGIEVCAQLILVGKGHVWSGSRRARHCGRGRFARRLLLWPIGGPHYGHADSSSGSDEQAP